MVLSHSFCAFVVEENSSSVTKPLPLLLLDQVVQLACQPRHAGLRDARPSPSAPLQAQVQPPHCQQHPPAGENSFRPLPRPRDLQEKMAGGSKGGANGLRGHCC